jgi:hypothetical protein
MYIEAAIYRSVTRNPFAGKYQRRDSAVSSSPAFENKSTPAPAASRTVPNPILKVHSGRIKT